MPNQECPVEAGAGVAEPYSHLVKRPLLWAEAVAEAAMPAASVEA